MQATQPSFFAQARWLDPDGRRVAVYFRRPPLLGHEAGEFRVRSRRSGAVLQTTRHEDRGGFPGVGAMVTLCATPATEDWPLCLEAKSAPDQWIPIHELEHAATAPFHGPVLMPGFAVAKPPAADLQAIATTISDAGPSDAICFVCSFERTDAFSVLGLLESLRNQIDPNWRLHVFCADSLPRETLWHVEAYARKDARIRRVSLLPANDEVPLAHAEFLRFHDATWICPLVSPRPLHPYFVSGLVTLTRGLRGEPFLGPQDLRDLEQLPPPFHRAYAAKAFATHQLLPSFACHRGFLAHVRDLLPSGFSDATPPPAPSSQPAIAAAPFPIHFHLDEPASGSTIRFPVAIRGWCCRGDLRSHGGLRLRHGSTIMETGPGLVRADVVTVLGEAEAALLSGFAFPPLVDLTPCDQQVRIEIRDDDRWYAIHAFSVPTDLATGVRLFNRAREICSRARSARLLTSYRATLECTEHRESSAIVDVIVPAYLGYLDTRCCIASLLAAPNRQPCEIVVVNDASPDARLTAWLEGEAAAGRITLITHQANAGFVASVNTGLALHPGRDVVLLNSDTEVCGDWLDRLRAAAYGDETIATASPLTNNGTICSFPRFCDANELPAAHSLAEVDHAFATTNADPITVPTTVGFCMFVKRAVMDRVGEFDVATFGLGYGEENDFCLRATAAGFRHVLCPTVFVYHKGSVSFLHSREARCRQALASLERLFPHYSQEIETFVRRDPARYVRARVQLDLLARRCGQAVLFVSHNWGGGVERHVRDLAALLRGSMQVLIFRPSVHAPGFSLASLTEPQSLAIDGIEFEPMVALLRAFPLVRVHVHHLITMENEALALPERLGLPYDITIHDYYSYCPQINLVDHHKHYCEEPAIAVCEECLKRRPRPRIADVATWRARNSRLLERAERVFVPTPSTAERISSRFPRARISVAPHPDAERSQLHRAPQWTYHSGPLRIVIIGTMNLFKGSRLIAQTVEYAEQHELPLEFHLLGEDQALLLRTGSRLTVSGGYREADLPQLLRQLRPHLVWFTSLTPETYSYTLSAAMVESLPIVATDLGAFHDRLRGRALTWLLPWTTPASKWCRLFVSLRTARPPASRSGPAQRPQQPHLFDYRSDYLPDVAPMVRDVRTPGRLTVAALVSESPDGVPDACAHIRLIRPLTHPAIAPVVAFRRITTHEAFCVRPDLLVVQRTALTDAEFVRRLVQHCRREAIKLVYEIDDALFDIPSDHPEFEHYRRYRPAIETLLRESDHVVTSSERLARHIGPFNASVSVLPNALDETLLPFPSSGPRTCGEEEGVVRILYMGTPTHQADLALLEPAFAQLRADYGTGISLEVIGVAPSKGDWFQPVPVPPDVARSYPEFMAWLHRRNHWDIAIAPLADSEFNQVKSPIKYFDYAALQLAVIASDVAPYRSVIANGRSGLLVSNHPDDWHRTLRLLINLPSYRKSLARAAHRQFLERHTLEAAWSGVWRCWEQIASPPIARSPQDGLAAADGQALSSAMRETR